MVASDDRRLDCCIRSRTLHGSELPRGSELPCWIPRHPQDVLRDVRPLLARVRSRRLRNAVGFHTQYVDPFEPLRDFVGQL